MNTVFLYYDCYFENFQAEVAFDHWGAAYRWPKTDRQATLLIPLGGLGKEN